MLLNTPEKESPRKPVTVSTIRTMKAHKEPISMITAYDVAMARNVNEAGIDMILVGDSLGNVVLGYQSTVPVTMDEMIHHTKAVMRGNSTALVVADMPFMSYQASLSDGLYNAGRLLKETGCTAVKLEGGSEVCELVEKLTTAGIPVVAHIGLTPQSVNQLGGFKVQGKDLTAAKKLLADAKALEAAGAFACVLECVPAALAASITAELNTMATIGIGAGHGCDGQVLVCNDLLGVSTGFCPKFVKQYANLHDITVNAVKEYIADVKSRNFPAPEHTFKIDDSVLEKLY
ncbi:3-methyl-2-oxobutanoate hydroxymethyltransferase [uncultured Veillonella sp.]|uniref:3-methyl-2-oxobutanoate hydroxymethyltransferase n=1 Tax=uncultured Veillonella sp. TaxID=159268 RepID=UPI00262FB3A6|nr:3-methyl-2-oxobutanoate hydroxymethyltransferase [uncultured Veillonella sp.]